MKIRKINSIIALLSASLALSSCIFDNNQSPKTPTEFTLIAVDNKSNSYAVGEIFDNFVTNGGLSPKVRMSDNTEKNLSKIDFTYTIKTATDTIVTATKPFENVGNYTVTVSRENLTPVDYTIRVNPKEQSVTLTSINAISYSNEVYKGEPYVFDGKVIANYSNDSQKDVTSKASISTISTDTIGEKNLSISYTEGSKTCDLTLQINVIEKQPTDVKVESITFNKTEIELKVEDHFIVETTILPENATNKKLTWESSCEDIATVVDGNITGKSVGNARITAKAQDGSNKSAYIEVEVIPSFIPVTDVFLSKSIMTIVVENSFTLYAGVEPDNASNKELTWESSNSAVATVSSIGVVTGLSAGTATITATAKDGSGCNDSCVVTVVAQAVPVTSVELSDSSISLTKGSTKSLSATVYPDNASNKELRWESNNSSVATVSSTGLVTAVKSGKATITATALDGSGQFDSCEVTVSTPVTDINLNKPNFTLNVNDTETLIATIVPSDADNKKITWSSNNNLVATVDNNGKVTAVGVGNAVISVETDDGHFVATCAVTVKSNTVTPESVTLSKTTLTLTPGNSSTLTATVGPTGASQNVTWSSNNSLITVSNGVVTASSSITSKTTATITCTATGYSSVSATCAVTVNVSGGSDEWTLVESDSQLVVGNKYVIASNAKGCTAKDLSNAVMGTANSTFSNDKKTITSLGADTVELTLGGTSGAWTLSNGSGNLLGAKEVKKLAWDEGTTTWDISISGGNATIQNGTESYGKFLYNVSSPRFTTYTSDPASNMLLPQLYSVSGTPVPAKTVDLDKTSLELSPGSSSQLTPIYGPKGANTDKDVTWSTSNSNVATVSDGLVEVKSTASVGSTATITCKLTSTGDTATCTISVVESNKAAWTIMIYMCGSTLEYDEGEVGLASGDLIQIMNATSIPSDVNIIVETGGAGKWYLDKNYTTSKSSISNTALQRWEVVSQKDSYSNNKLKPISTLNTNQMAKQSSFQNFLEWGLTDYPAENTGVIMWNHGGALGGVCSDENYYDGNYANTLNTIEVAKATEAAFTTTKTDKLTFIGYDACLMGVADIASVNSDYFNYMIASEESEPGSGWDYTTLCNTVFSNKTNSKTNIETILSKICSSFVKENCDNDGCGGTYWDPYNYEYYTYECYSTLAAYDLSKMETLVTEFNNYATKVKGSYSKIKTAFKSNKNYRFSEDDYGALYGVSDFIKFLDAMDSQFTSVSSTNLRNAVEALVISNCYCDKYDFAPCGVCVFLPETTATTSKYGLQCEESDYTGEYASKFTVWQQMCLDYGTW